MTDNVWEEQRDGRANSIGLVAPLPSHYLKRRDSILQDRSCEVPPTFTEIRPEIYTFTVPSALGQPKHDE